MYIDQVSNKNITFNSNGGVWLNSRDDDIVQTYLANSNLKLDNSVGNGSYTVSKPGYKLIGWADKGHSNTKVLTEPAIYRYSNSDIKRLRISQSGDYIEILAYIDGATNVKFPTWTDGNGQDDIVWHDAWRGDWTRDNEKYNWGFGMNLSQNHNGEAATYNTHQI